MSITEQEIEALHKLCDIAGVPYSSSFYEITLALHDKLFPDGAAYPKNREERRRKQGSRQIGGFFLE